MLRDKFLALTVYVRKEDRSKTKNFSVHLRKLEKEEQAKSNVSRKKEWKFKTGKPIEKNQ